MMESPGKNGGRLVPDEDAQSEINSNWKVILRETLERIRVASKSMNGEPGPDLIEQDRRNEV